MLSESPDDSTRASSAERAANASGQIRERTPWRDPQSGYVRRNSAPAGFPSPIRIVEVVLPAGARGAYETGAREVSLHRQIWVQEGSIEVTVGRVTHRLREDDCLAMRLDEPTAFRNRTRKPARYVVVVATLRSCAASASRSSPRTPPGRSSAPCRWSCARPRTGRTAAT